MSGHVLAFTTGVWASGESGGNAGLFTTRFTTGELPETITYPPFHHFHHFTISRSWRYRTKRLSNIAHFTQKVARASRISRALTHLAHAIAPRPLHMSDCEYVGGDVRQHPPAGAQEVASDLPTVPIYVSAPGCSESGFAKSESAAVSKPPRVVQHRGG